MKNATWTPAPEQLRPGYKAFRLLDTETGRGLARLGVDPHNPRRPYRISMWHIDGICLDSNTLTPEQMEAILTHTFHEYDPTGLDLPE